ncbi:MAG: hypothetical protein ACRDGI_06230 [Candidatus Limnocylindrales bacterium]
MSALGTAWRTASGRQKVTIIVAGLVVVGALAALASPTGPGSTVALTSPTA